jgi:hypothetical protein
MVPANFEDRSMHKSKISFNPRRFRVMVPAAEVEDLQVELATVTERLRQVERELETARGMASRPPAVERPTKATTTDEDSPAFLDRRPLSPGDQLTLDAVMVAWAKSTELRAALVGGSAVVLERFTSCGHRVCEFARGVGITVMSKERLSRIGKVPETRSRQAGRRRRLQQAGVDLARVLFGVLAS